MALFSPGGFAAKLDSAPSPVGAGGRTVTPRGPAPFMPTRYNGILSGMPGVVAANNNAALSASDAGSARQAATRAASFNFGGVPTGFQDKYGDLTSADLTAAQNNPYSAVAQNERAFGQNDYAMKQALAARHTLDSGQLVTNLGNQNYQRGLDLYNLANQFGSTVNSAIGSYTGVLGQNRSDIANAILQAQHDASVNPGYAPAPSIVATTTPRRKTSRFVPPNHHLLERGL